jgi:photosynthetic reaction center cytochrome c subunit
MRRVFSGLVTIAAASYLSVSGFVVVRSGAQTQMTAPVPGQKAGGFFKNVTTSTLKELSADDFVASMGVISAALGFDCADCHPGAGTDAVNWTIDTAPKRMARRMVEMVATLNRTNFGGAQKVTCWTCHHGRQAPATSVMLDNWYDAPNSEVDDLVVSDKNEPPADQVFDKYVLALGGAAKLATLTSWVATGTSIGYGELGGNAAFSIYAKAPNQRTTRVTYPDHPERPSSVWAFNGRTGWTKTPRALLQQYELAGQELDGQRFEAQLAFPAQIKQILNNWRTGHMRSIGDRAYRVVQGNGPKGFLATLYFDPDSGLLTRLVRYGSSPVGRVLSQVDYADYRDVGGIKFPFELKFSWLDGRYTAKITDVKVNVPIDDATFGRP